MAKSLTPAGLFALIALLGTPAEAATLDVTVYTENGEVLADLVGSGTPGGGTTFFPANFLGNPFDQTLRITTSFDAGVGNGEEVVGLWFTNFTDPNAPDQDTFAIIFSEEIFSSDTIDFDVTVSLGIGAVDYLNFFNPGSYQFSEVTFGDFFLEIEPISQIPLPSTLFLLGAGLSALLLQRYGKSSQRSLKSDHTDCAAAG